LKSIDLCGEIGFASSWTRRKKRNGRLQRNEIHPFCDLKANAASCRRLPVLTSGEKKTKKREASNANYLAVTQRTRWAKEKDPNRRLFLHKKSCEYNGITEEDIHALVGYGKHGRHEFIQDFKCQACGKKFTARRNTILYRLKSHSGLVEKILWLLALEVDASALEEVFGVREITIRT
jgi:hypothetical protein